MTVQFETPTPTEGILHIALEQTDVQPRVEKKLREVAQRVAIKGFRPGKAPAQMVKKMYGEEILIQEMNDMIGDAINDYFTNNKDIFMLGNPMPMETEERIDLKRPETYKFAFKCGLVPPFEYDLAQLYVKDYEVIVDDKAIDRTIHDLQHQHGKFGKADFISNEDIVKGALYDTLHDYSEEDSRPADSFEEGTEEGSAKFYMDVFLPMTQIQEGMKQHFLNSTVGTIIHFDIQDLMSDTDKGLSLLVGKPKEVADKLQGDFAFEVKEIMHQEHPELNEEFFKKVFPTDDHQTIEEFREALKKDTTKYYDTHNKTLKKNQLKKQLVANTAIEVPHQFLKEFLVSKSKDETMENIEKNYENIEKSVRWEILTTKLGEKFDVKVASEEIEQEGFNALMQMFSQYGQSPEIINYIEQMLPDYVKKNASNLVQNVVSSKVLDAILQDLTPAKQMVSEDEFWQIYNEQ
jgi:trigger factor